MKIPKIKRYEYLLENEGKTLRTLERSIDGIPKVLFVDNSTGLLSIGETFLHGSPLSKLITPAVDLIFFLILANFHMENAWETVKFLKVYGNIFDPSTLAGEVYEECTNLYKNEIGIEHTNLRAFHIIAFISWLHIRIRNFIEHPTDLINNTYFRLWKEELLNP